MAMLTPLVSTSLSTKNPEKPALEKKVNWPNIGMIGRGTYNNSLAFA
jgi:hypothetical protein